MSSSIPSLVTLNIGGVLYTTTYSTIINGPNGFLKEFVTIAFDSSSFDTTTDSNGNIFIDRNGKMFECVLDYLITKIPVYDSKFDYFKVMVEFDYYFNDPIQLYDTLSYQFMTSTFGSDLLTAIDYEIDNGDDFDNELTFGRIVSNHYDYLTYSDERNCIMYQTILLNVISGRQLQELLTRIYAGKYYIFVIVPEVPTEEIQIQYYPIK